jgi:hypothetical protein
VPELQRLAKTIVRWETPIPRWHRTQLTDAATEGTKLVVKNIKRLGFRFRNYENYRLRLLCAAAAMATATRRMNTAPPTTPQGVVPPSCRTRLTFRPIDEVLLLCHSASTRNLTGERCQHWSGTWPVERPYDASEVPLSQCLQAFCSAPASQLSRLGYP